MDTWKKHVVSGGGWLLLGMAVAGYCQAFLVFQLFFSGLFFLVPICMESFA